MFGRSKVELEWEYQTQLAVYANLARNRKIRKALEEGWTVESMSPHMIHGTSWGNVVLLKRRNPKYVAPAVATEV